MFALQDITLAADASPAAAAQPALLGADGPEFTQVIIFTQSSVKVLTQQASRENISGRAYQQLYASCCMCQQQQILCGCQEAATPCYTVLTKLQQGYICRALLTACMSATQVQQHISFSAQYATVTPRQHLGNSDQQMIKLASTDHQQSPYHSRRSPSVPIAG